MERLVIDISFVIISLGIGYLIGYKACFDYLREELENYKKGHR